MKKSVLFAAVAVVASLLVSCQGDVSPLTSSTKLWPAANKDGSKWGYINEAASDLVIDATYGMTYPFSCKRAVVQKLSGDAYLVIDESGKEIDTEVLHQVGDHYFAYDALPYINGSGKYGMININGGIIFSDEYLYLGSMSSCDLVVFMELQNGQEKYGYLKRGQTKEAIGAKFDNANTFVDDAAVVMEGTERGIIGTDGKYLAKWKLSENYDGLYSLGQKRVAYKEKDATLWGMKTLDGEKKGGAKFQDIDPFTDCDLARVQDEEGKYGFVNTEGTLVIKCKYESARSFYEGIAWVKEENSPWKAIDKNGEKLFSLKEEDALYSSSIPGVFHNGLCLVIKNGTYKYIDKEGNPKDYSWTNGAQQPGFPVAGYDMNDEFMSLTPYGYLFKEAAKVKNMNR